MESADEQTETGRHGEHAKLEDQMKGWREHEWVANLKSCRGLRLRVRVRFRLRFTS